MAFPLILETRMKRFGLSCVFAAVLIPAVASAQSYPSPTYKNLTLQGALTSGDGSALTVVLGGAISRTLAARFGETIDLLDYATGPVQGTGAVDDGPMFRAAIAACVSGNGFRRLHVPQAQSVWLIGSLDASGLGGLVIGDGAHQNSCWLDGDAPNTTGGWVGGVNIKLSGALNRPLVYIQPGVGSPIFSNMRLDGNGSAQSGWSGGPIGGKLFTMEIADGAGGTEGAVYLTNVTLTGGYNGDLYQGSGRGIIVGFNVAMSYSGQSLSDAAYYANGYDVFFSNLSVGPNVGNGVTLNEGSQYQIHGGAIFLNGNNGIVVQGYLVNYSDVEGVNIQWNGCNGVLVNANAPSSGQVSEGHIWRGLTFDGNSHTTAGACNDFTNMGSSVESLIAPVFGGAELTSSNKPGYNVYNAPGTAAVTSVLGQTLGTGTSATVAFTNDFNRVVTNQQGKFTVGDVAPLADGWLFSVNDTRQFLGQEWTNGTHAIARLFGTTSANDSGVLQLFNGGVIEVQLSAGNGVPDYFQQYVGFGGQTNPQYPVDVTGTVNASSGYRANGVAGVSCAAGTVNLSTFTITSGIVTHC